MTAPFIVLDTGFLWGYYGVPRSSAQPDQLDQTASRAKMRGAVAKGAQCFVPCLVLYELANAIAHERERSLREALARTLAEDARRSLGPLDQAPWLIIPSEGKQLQRLFSPDGIRETCETFRDAYAPHPRPLGMVDMLVQSEAQRLKGKHQQRPVYIWTNDAALKEREPDREPDSWWR